MNAINTNGIWTLYVSNCGRAPLDEFKYVHRLYSSVADYNLIRVLYSTQYLEEAVDMGTTALTSCDYVDDDEYPILQDDVYLPEDWMDYDSAFDGMDWAEALQHAGDDDE